MIVHHNLVHHANGKSKLYLLLRRNFILSHERFGTKKEHGLVLFTTYRFYRFLRAGFFVDCSIDNVIKQLVRVFGCISRLVFNTLQYCPNMVMVHPNTSDIFATYAISCVGEKNGKVLRTSNDLGRSSSAFLR